MIKDAELNGLLIGEFEAMKKAYDDEGDYDDYSPALFYDSEFEPYIVEQLDKNNETELKKIFAFIEKLFRECTEYAAETVNAGIIDPLCYEKVLHKHRETIYGLCGELTRKRFDDMEEKLTAIMEADDDEAPAEDAKQAETVAA